MTLQGRSWPPLSVAFLVWGMGAALYFLAFFQRVTPAVMTRELMTEFGIGAAALGNLSAFYFYTYVGIQIPTGLLVDRYGPRRILTLGAGIAALGTLAFALAPTYALAGLGRLLVGASVGVAFVAMLKLAAHWFAPSRFALLSGLSLFIGILGAIGAGAPLRMAADAFGWRSAMLGGAAVSALLCVATGFIVRDDPGERGYASHAAPQPNVPGQSLLAGLREVTRYRNVRTLFFLAGGFTAPMLTFAGLWAVPFLTTRYGIATTQAALVTSATLLAWGIGGPVFGGLSDRLGRRKPIYALGLIASLIGWAIVWLVPALPLPLLITVMILTGFFSGSVIISFAWAKESAPAHLAGTTSGVANMGNMLGGMIMQPIVGWVLDRMWSGGLTGGVRVYEFGAYRAGLSLMLVWMVVCLILLALTRESHCRQMV